MGMSFLKIFVVLLDDVAALLLSANVVAALPVLKFV
jgi:hypothetical protein